MGPGRLVTPEAVVLDVPHAGPGTRMAAKALDIAIQFVGLFLIDVVIGAAASGGSGNVVFIVVALVVDVLAVFGYPAILESVWRGRTVGKAAFGLRVLTREGAPIRFRHALIRSLLFIVDGFLIGPAVGVLCLLLTRDTVRVGDLVAGTIVIRERTGAAAPAPMYFSPPYGRESYVATLDVGRLSADDYALVRNFLIRAPQLAPEVRFPLAVELATPILHKLSAGDPHMHPEEFLQCVVAAVQRRYTPGWGAAPGWAAAPEWGAGPGPGWGGPPDASAPQGWGEANPVAPPGPAPAPAMEPRPAPDGGGFAPPS